MSDHFCLKWNNFHNSILSAFESLHSSEELVDVTLMCEGQNVKAHKVILSACSPYFRNLFKETPCQHPIIILKDVLHCDLLAILQFMYQGEVLVTQENLSSFLKTAELLQVTGLAGNTSTQVPHTPEAATEPKLAPVPPLVHIPARSITPTTTSPLTLSTPSNDVSLTKLVEKENVSTEDEALPDEPMQSCSYPHDELVIKTETEDPDFPEMEFANVNEENVDGIRPSTDESILKRSLKAQDSLRIEDFLQNPGPSTSRHRTPKEDPPGRLSMDLKTHVLERIIGTGKQKFLQRKCRVCASQNIRSETRYKCKSCEIPLHRGKCFERYHTLKYYQY